MMLTATIGGTSSMAPRQSRLKKPRPLRLLSTQEGPVDKGGAPAGVVKERNQGLGILEVDVSAARDGSQGSPVCKEIAALSSRLLSFTNNQSDSMQKCTSLSLQDSSSCNSSFEQHCVYRYQGSISPPSTASASASAVRHRHHSVSTELPFSLETCFQYANLRSQNINGNSNCESFHMPLDAYDCQSKCDLSDEGYATISMDRPATARARFEFSTPIAAGSQSTRTRDQDTNQSFQPEPTMRATKAMLLTSTGDELNLIGKNVKTILHASRILLKEMDAKLVRIETLSDDELDKDETLSDAYEPDTSEVAVPDEASDLCVMGCFPRQRRWNTSWHYSKDELLLLSRSMLSHQPPSNWRVIAGAHADCCIPAYKVRNYFEPSAFHCSDGSLIVDKCWK